MDKKLERANKEKILRKIALNLKELGFTRSKPTFFVREYGPLVEFIHFHKYSFGPTFRLHICLRVLNDPKDFIALTGITSEMYCRANSPNGKKYNFSYHKTEDTVERCRQNIQAFVTEVAEPWYKKWRDLSLLVNDQDSPLPIKERLSLQEYLSGNTCSNSINQTKELLKVK